jgi:hypothetical protein
MTKLIGRITERSYYDFFPPSTHAPGDIWMHLPAHGLLRRDLTTALVVTPSCDLSNRKVSTITYLPIISFPEWVSCRDFLPEVVGSMSSLVEQLGPLGISSSFGLSNDEIFSAELSEQLLILENKLANEKIAKPVRNACERYISGGRHLKRVSCGELADVRDLEVCLTKSRWQQLRSQVVKNALRSDLYFLPADGNDVDTSPIAKHSVALFRYPMTAPVSVLDSAQDASLSDWAAATSALATHEPMARAFSHVRPLKCLRLQDRFLSDLLTKFVALYSRLGSPDFSQESVEAISRELGEFK